MKHALFALVVLLILVTPSFGQVGGDIQFVTHLYRILLNREGEPGGIINWVAALITGTQTRAGTINGFLQSPEYRSNPALHDKWEAVRRTYRVILRREPAADEVAVWVPSPWETIFAGFYSSQEYLSNPGAFPAMGDDDLASGFLPDELAAAVADGGFEGDLALDEAWATIDQQTNLGAQQASTAPTPAWAIALIVVGCVVSVALIVVAVQLFRLMRKN